MGLRVPGRTAATGNARLLYPRCLGYCKEVSNRETLQGQGTVKGILASNMKAQPDSHHGPLAEPLQNGQGSWWF